MIRTVIIDDEVKSRSILGTMLSKFCPEIKVVGECGNREDAIKLITTTRPQLAFLDINMPNGSGFDVLTSFPREDFEVIFITAHHQYAIKALRISALDYLLKPLNIKELQSAVERARVKLAQKGEVNNLAVLVENLKQNIGEQSKIAVPVGTGLQFVTIREIIRLEAEGNYTHLHLQEGRPLLSTRHLKEYEILLPSHLFFRSHHSHIINLEHAIRYQRGEGGSVQLSDRSEVPVAKRRKKLFLELFKA